MIATTNYRRPYQLLKIRSRQKPSDFSVVNAADFSTEIEKILDNFDQLNGFVPYCFDNGGDRVVYTYTPDIQGLAEAPFLYQGQYEKAERLLSVPFERLLEIENAFDSTPTFVLSIGRCGSTLLSKLAKSANQPSVAEPDVYTQLASLPGGPRVTLGSPACLTLLRGWTAALSRQFGAGVIIKLRSHCNAIASLLLEALPNAKYAFVLRDPVEWAHSRHRSFGDGPRALAGMIRTGIETYDYLVTAGSNPALIWYDEIVNRPAEVLTKLGVPRTSLDGGGGSARFAAVLSTDVQAGTKISRESFGERRLSEEDVKKFEEEWAAIAPYQLIERHGLERLRPSRRHVAKDYLNTNIHLHMLEDAKRVGQPTIDGLYGLQWGDPEKLPALQTIRDKWLLPYIKPDHCGLEIGPGGGRWTRYMLGFHSLYVVDYHQELLDELKTNFNLPNIIFTKNNGTDFPEVPDGSIDFVFSFGVFVHLHAEIIKSYLDNMRRVLKPTASIIIQYSDKDKAPARDNPSFSENNPRVMRSMVEQAAYRIVEEDTTILWHSSIMRFQLASMAAPRPHHRQRKPTAKAFAKEN